MNKVLSLLLIIFVSTSCQLILDEVNTSHQLINSQIDSNKLRIEALEAWCEKANTNIATLTSIVSALQDHDNVIEIEPIIEDGKEIGYILTFSKGGTATIYHGTDGIDGVDGVDGETPIVGIKKDEDGFYYWTVNDEWLLDSENNKITAGGVNGITPQLRIRGGYWELSNDGGVSWIQTEKAVGKDGRSFFSDVVISESLLTLTLINGEIVSIPIVQGLAFELNIEADSLAACAGNVLEISYRVVNANENTVITASTDGKYSVQLKKDSYSTGSLIIGCPTEYLDGYINLCASTNGGLSFVKVIKFFEGNIIFKEENVISINSFGGKVVVPFRTNFDYFIEIEPQVSSWLSITSENIDETSLDSLTLEVSKNTTFEARTGKINIYSKYGKLPYGEIVVNQEPALFTISEESFELNHTAQLATVRIVSTLGLTVRIDDNPGWIKVSNIKTTESTIFNLTFEIQDNLSDSPRTCTISLSDESGTRPLGKISITQLAEELIIE